MWTSEIGFKRSTKPESHEDLGCWRFAKSIVQSLSAKAVRMYGQTLWKEWFNKLSLQMDRQEDPNPDVSVFFNVLSLLIFTSSVFSQGSDVSLFIFQIKIFAEDRRTLGTCQRTWQSSGLGSKGVCRSILNDD